MTEDDADTILQWYERFIENIRQVAMDAEEQKKELKRTVVADEIALDFSSVGMLYAKKLLECNWITKDIFLLAESIDKKFAEMSDKKDVWTDDALDTCEEWRACREMGRKLLEILST